MIAWFYHVAEILVLKCPIRDLLVPVDVPCGNIAFARSDRIIHVVVKLRYIHVSSSTSCKHGRHPFTQITGMCRNVQLPWLQSQVECFYVVYQFWINPRRTILLVFLRKITSHIADQALICTVKRHICACNLCHTASGGWVQADTLAPRSTTLVLKKRI